MDVAIQRLKQLDKEIASASRKQKKAWKANLRATDPYRKAILHKIWLQLWENQEALVAGRKALRDFVKLQAMLRLAEWAAKTGEEDEDNPWLELPEGVFFPSLSEHDRCVYIRDAYRKLADAMEDLRTNQNRRHVIVSGNPGIGKSCFAHWMLVRWQRMGFEVLWHGSGDEFFYFKDGTVSSLSEAQAYYVLKCEKELHYIVDEATPYSLLNVKQSFVVHVPDDTRSSPYKNYIKDRWAAMMPLFIPQWDYKELDMIRLKLHPGITEQKMKQMIARRGAIPKYVLADGIEEYTDKWLEGEVSDVVTEWEDIWCAIPGRANGTYRIAAIHPTHWQEGDFSHFELKFLSAAVRDAVTKKLLDLGELAHLMQLVYQNALSGSAPERLVAELAICVEESIVHAVLKEGGSWLLRELPARHNKGPVAIEKSAQKHIGSSESRNCSSEALLQSSEEASAVSSSISASEDRKLSIDKLPEFYFTHAEELDDVPDNDAYLQPTSPNHPAIDAIVISGSTAYLFKGIRDGSHTINNEVCEVLAHLPAHLHVDWIWVLPPDIWAQSNFTVREVPSLEGTDFSTAQVQLIKERLEAIQKQYKMAVPELSVCQRALQAQDADALYWFFETRVPGAEYMHWFDKLGLHRACSSVLSEAGKTLVFTRLVDTAKPRNAGKATMGKAAVKQHGAWEPAKQQQETGIAAADTGKAGRRRKKRDVGSASAVLVEGSRNCSIIARPAQVSHCTSARILPIPRLLHTRARPA